MLEQARRLDPLAPKYDVLKAKFLAFGHGNLREADAVLVDVVARYPHYYPAVNLLADVRRFEGNLADAIMYDEQALKLDPLSDWTRWLLIYNYNDVADTAATIRVADEAPHRLPILRLGVLIAEGSWRQAAEVTYAALADGPLTDFSEPYGVFALRMDAHRTHEFGRARVAFEKMCGVTWSAGGVPALPPQLGFGSACVAVGDMLISRGERARGERLLRACLAAMDYAAYDLKRGELWYLIDRATAFALLGDRKAALAALHKTVGAGYLALWSSFELDTAFDKLRGDAEFQSLMRAIKANVAHQRQILEQMRADGRVPDRRAMPR